MVYKKLVSLLYLILALFCFVLIYMTAKLLFAYHIDGYHNGFFIHGLSDLTVNFNVSTGRWAQGLTNDYRLYTNRTLITVINNLLFFGSLFFLVYQVFKDYVIIITSAIYFSILYNTYQPSHFRYLIHTLATSLSYTLGTSLMFLFFGLYFRYRKKRSQHHVLILVSSTLLLIFITGLVEYLFVFLILLIGYIVFEEVFFSLKNKKLKVPKVYLYYLSVTLIGAVTVVLSPGSRKRRVETSKRLEGTEFGGAFNFESYGDSLHEMFLSLMNLSNLILLLFLIVVFSIIKKSNNSLFQASDQRGKAIFLTLFSFALMLMPITVGFIASNGKIGMPKAYNFTSIAFILFLVVSAYTLNVFFNLKFKKAIVNVVLVLPFVCFCYAYTTKGNNLYFQQDQIFSGNLAEVNEEIFARRQYLVETNTVFGEKVIPTLSPGYRGKVFAGADNVKVKHKYYNKAFNNTIPVYLDNSLPKPREFTSIFLAMNKKIKPIYSTEEYNVYYNKRLHTLVIENEDSVFDQPLSKFKIRAITKRGDEIAYDLDLNRERKKHESYYSKNDKHVALVLPNNTEFIEVIEFGDCLLDMEDALVKENSEYKTNYGNIMR